MSDLASESHRNTELIGDTRIEVPRLLLFLDHDNVFQGGDPLRSAIREWIRVLSLRMTLPPLLRMRIRAYGGWFAGSVASEQRYSAAAYYQTSVPTAMAIDRIMCKMTFEFADTLDEGQGTRCNNPFRITHTVVEREKPYAMRLRSDRPRCDVISCKLTDVKNWLKKGRACPSMECTHQFSEFFVRKEQKQVDVHLSTDLLCNAMTAHPNSHFAVMSDDMDFVPAIVAARRIVPVNVTIAAIRCDPCPAYVADVYNREDILTVDVPGT